MSDGACYIILQASHSCSFESHVKVGMLTSCVLDCMLCKIQSILHPKEFKQDVIFLCQQGMK